MAKRSGTSKTVKALNVILILAFLVAIGTIIGLIVINKMKKRTGGNVVPQTQIVGTYYQYVNDEKNGNVYYEIKANGELSFVMNGSTSNGSYSILSNQNGIVTVTFTLNGKTQNGTVNNGVLTVGGGTYRKDDKTPSGTDPEKEKIKGEYYEYDENGNKTDNYLDIKPDGTYEYHKDGTTYDGTYDINKNPDGTYDITFNGEGGLDSGTIKDGELYTDDKSFCEDGKTPTVYPEREKIKGEYYEYDVNGNKTDNYLNIKSDGTYEYHKDGTTYDGTYDINKNSDGTIDITFDGKGGLDSGTIKDGELYTDDKSFCEAGKTPTVYPARDKIKGKYYAYDDNWYKIPDEFWEIKSDGTWYYQNAKGSNDDGTYIITVLDIGTVINFNKPLMSNATVQDKVLTYNGKSYYRDDAGLPDVPTDYDFTYSVVSGKAVVTGLAKQSVTTLAIPSLVVENEKTYRVTEIANNAFKDCSNLTQIMLPMTLTAIGNNAFENTSITSMILPSSVETFGTGIFKNCTLLQSANLEDVSVMSGNFYVSTFDGCINLSSVKLPNNCTTIGNGMFKGCVSLTNVTIPDSVTSMGKGVFSGCTSLKRMTLPFVGSTKFATTNRHFGYIFGASTYAENATSVPSSLKTVTVTKETDIAENAFYECSSINNISLPKTLKSVGKNAFKYNAITSLHISDLSAWCKIDFDGTFALPIISSDANNETTSMYLNNFLVENLVIPDDITEIKPYAFRFITSIKTLDLNNVNSVGYGSFGGCTNLNSIDFGSSLSSIAERAFSYCNSLTKAVIPDSVTSMGKGVFDKCLSLTSIELPFVGSSIAASENSHFGYIFGASTYAENVNYVPSSLKTVNVTKETSVAENAFYGCKHIVNVLFADTLKDIGNSAFADCSSLSITRLPTTVTSIGEYAYKNCADLDVIVVPDSVMIMGKGVFSGCTSLKGIQLPFVGSARAASENSHFGYIFGASTDVENQQYVPTNLAVIVITDETQIAERAFDNCENIETINLMDSPLVSIGDNAFGHCFGLMNIKLPSSLKTVGAYVFTGLLDTGVERNLYIKDLAAWCDIDFAQETLQNLHAKLYVNGNLVETLKIPNGVITVKPFTFAGVSSIKTVDFNQANLIGQKAFIGCTNLKTIAASNLAQIAPKAFYGCSALEYVSLGSNNLSSILEGAFAYCSSLKTFTVPYKVIGIGKSVFKECSSLESLTIPFVGEKGTGTTNNFFGYIFGASTYQQNASFVPSSLKTVTITETTTIPENAFYGCDSINVITLPTTVNDIGSYAFKDCSSLKSVNLSSNLRSIGNNAFENCKALSTVTIPNNVTSVQDGTFKYCTSLATVNFSSNLQSIGSESFYGCNKLGSISLPSKLTTIGDKSFAFCSSLTSLTVPSKVTSIGTGAFGGCHLLASATVPTSVTSMGESVFNSCVALKSITLPFVGSKRAATTNGHFGYIFGASTYEQNSSFVPTNLASVILTDETNIADYAFNGCSSITSITIPKTLRTTGKYAFKGVYITNICIEDLAAWCNIVFGDGKNLYSLPTRDNSAEMYLNGNLIEDLVIPNGVTEIKDLAFFNIRSIKSADLNNVKSVGIGAFAACKNLTTLKLGSSLTSIGKQAFSGSVSIANVTYANTMAKWSAVSLGGSWISTNCNIVCTDGTIAV